MAKIRVAAYCRVSTEMEMQEGSLHLQEEWFTRKYNNREDCVLVGIYSDERSGTELGRRPGLCNLLRDCAAGKIDLVVTKSVSRLARNTADFLWVIRALQDAGVAVEFEREGLNTFRVQGEMMLSILAAMAQEEVNVLSNSVAWSVRQRDAQGKPNYRVSYGFCKENGSDVWSVNEKEAARVRLAFQLAAEGETYQQICARLNEWERHDPTGVEWRQRRLHILLTNIHYMGDVLTQKTYAPDYLSHKRRRNRGALPQCYLEEHHPAIVSRSLFQKVNDMIASGTLHSGRKKVHSA